MVVLFLKSKLLFLANSVMIGALLADPNYQYEFILAIEGNLRNIGFYSLEINAHKDLLPHWHVDGTFLVSDDPANATKNFFEMYQKSTKYFCEH
jgi:hypothetical protein